MDIAYPSQKECPADPGGGQGKAVERVRKERDHGLLGEDFPLADHAHVSSP